LIVTPLDTMNPLQIIMSEVIDGNMATHTGLDLDDAATNRARLVQQVGEPIQWMTQTHSALVEAPEFVSANPINADGCVGKPGFAVGVLTADCLPVMLYSESGLAYAGVHAGWRGLLDGILLEALEKMSCPSQSPIKAFIGPCISKQAYQVERDFVERFEERWNLELNSCYTTDGVSHVRVDLAELAKTQLATMGVSTELSGLCTATDGRFFSYRENQTSSRIATVIGRAGGF